MAALQAKAHILAASVFSAPKPSSSLSSSKTLISPFHRVSLAVNNSTITKAYSCSRLSLSNLSINNINCNRRRCFVKSSYAASAQDSTFTDDVQTSETETNHEKPPTLISLINVYKQAILDKDWSTVSDIEAKITSIENDKMDDVQVSENESDQEDRSSLTSLISSYKEAILEEDFKTVADIEARITAIENVEIISDDAPASESEIDQEGSPSLTSLINVYKQAILEGDSKTVSDIEAKITAFEIDNNSLVQTLTELSEDNKSMKDRYIRLQADFDNFRKRTENEKLNIRSDAQGEVVENLLPIVDSFDRAKKALKLETENEKKIDASYQGIYKQLEDILRSLKVTAVPTVGKPFDPALHDAIAQGESEELDEGVILEEFRRGFVLGERLLRPAMVKVSAGPGPQKTPAQTDESTEQPASGDGEEQ
ncbi:hypothetical protein ACFE04_015310 [Oxalis oulophora]